MTTSISPGLQQSINAEFADSAADFLGRQDHRARVRRLRSAEAASFERPVWQEIAEAGWLSIVIAEEDGGLGLTLKEAAAVAQTAGEHLLPEPFVMAGVMPALALAPLRASARRTQLLSGLADGSTVCGLAWQERAGQLVPGRNEATAKEDAEGWSLSGQKLFVDPGPGADGWLVLARMRSSVGLFWVVADAAGVSLRQERRVDGQFVSTLQFDEVRLDAADLLAEGSEAMAAVRTACDGARLVQAAELVGVARRALAITLDYARTRVQFGKPIGVFQALQHRLVDVFLQIELATATLHEALHGYVGAQGARLASRAKARCAHAALETTRQAIQLHGAMGNTDECEIGLYFKRALALNASLGSVAAHRRRYFDDALGTAEPHEAAPAQTACDEPAAAATGDWDGMTEAAFRQMVRTFLEQNYPPALRHFPRGLHWEEVCDWYVTVSRRGWGAPAWPKEHGGMGLSPDKLMAFHDEMERYGVARWIDPGVEMLGPLLMRFGTEAQREHYLPRILTGEHVWCQGYSEPNAGSDLGSLSTRAELVDEEFVVNGRKIWTSHAQEATHIFLLVRTEPKAKASAAISFLLVDMKTPGISLRRIQDLTDDEPFCEVTFDDVRVPAANLVGALNSGWMIAKALLGFERLFIGNPSPVMYAMTQLTQLARSRGLFDDAAFAARYAQLAMDTADLNALYNRFADILRRGEQPGPDISLLKICCTETWQRVAACLAESADEQGALIGAQQVEGASLQILSPTFNALPSSIYGGSNEIQRNILARQVLDLPG
ncbi:acyl-CoA dehydrogenase family protein [Hydrogenophaga sp. YM1]|uniref:acyl-CoA dehydrogenase n=1 Tax=Hydrogenophaga sp. YM1 TaxID=2806262 RepID=UPI0019582DB5|nr:acyl-CoA dehydrogenase [Hydrogenophaga sp. YM1]QRR33997.1 acyl-CoA dehydrogenase family protein [Hydrogenophaga sp. YM1]